MGTLADVRVDIVLADGPVETGVGIALVDLALAKLAMEPVDAETPKVANLIDASASVLTRIGFALVFLL